MRVNSVSYENIVDDLFKRWIRTKYWNPVSKSTIERIVKNEFYIWLLKFRWKTYKWVHETFISEELFREANKDVKTYEAQDTSYENGFFLKEILRYKWKKMSAYQKKWFIYYKNWAWVKPAINISQNEIIKVFEEHIKEYTSPEKWLKQIKKWFWDYYKEYFKENKKNYIITISWIKMLYYKYPIYKNSSRLK